MKIKVMSRLEAIQHSFLKEIPTCAIVSISSGSTNPTFYLGQDTQVKGIYYMSFDDITTEIEGYKACQPSDFGGLGQFINQYKDTVDEIIVHCHAGISRSSATASAICKYLGEDDSFIWNSGDYSPNNRVYEIACGALGV
jgi:predicted protein tyrosine phosphatase